MTRRFASIIGWGHYVPDRVVTNDDLAALVDTSDDWIQSRTGIRERRYVADGQATSDLCVRAAQRALQVAEVEPDEVDLVIVSSSSPDYRIPPVSSQVQAGLGAVDAGALTVGTGCAGFVYALVTAEQFIASGAARTVVVVGGETLSRYLDFSNRATCVLFGDGAGALVLQASPQPCGSLTFELGSDGTRAEAIISRASGSAMPPTPEALEAHLQHVSLDGRAVFRFATGVIADSVRRVTEDVGMSVDDLDFLIPHQANARILERAAKALGLPEEKLVMNVDRYGNTSSASIPIAMSELLSDGRAVPGDTLALVGFGTGLAWAPSLFQLGPLEPWPMPTTAEVLALPALVAP